MTIKKALRSSDTLRAMQFLPSPLKHSLDGRETAGGWGRLGQLLEIGKG